MDRNFKKPKAGCCQDKSALVTIAETLLGEIDWFDADCGYCSCPGERFHTSTNGYRDCRVTLDKVPTVYCVHSSCRSEIEKANYELRSSIGKMTYDGSGAIRTTEKITRRRERETFQRLKLQAENSLPQILEKFATDPVDFFESSPARLFDDPEGDWSLLLNLFRSDDIVWIGSIYDSGEEENEINFRAVRDWLKERQAPGPLICPNTFKPGVCSRSNKNVLDFRFLVVESDILSKLDISAVFTWIRQFLRLRAIVDTAGKSLHGWFGHPSTAQLHELKMILPQLGCDPALFKPSQPVRLPGAMRGQKTQSLLYLDLEDSGNEEDFDIKETAE